MLKSSFKKHLIWLIPVIALIALVLLMKASGNGQTQIQPTAAKKHLVSVMPIEWHGQYVQKRLVVGRAEALQTTAIGFDLPGAVVDILVDEGQMVIQGQVLAQLDDQRLMAQMSELSAIYPNDCVFQNNVATDSRRKLPPNPREGCHPCWCKQARQEKGIQR